MAIPWKRGLTSNTLRGQVLEELGDHLEGLGRRNAGVDPNGAGGRCLAAAVVVGICVVTVLVCSSRFVVVLVGAVAAVAVFVDVVVSAVGALFGSGWHCSWRLLRG